MSSLTITASFGWFSSQTRPEYSFSGCYVSRSTTSRSNEKSNLNSHADALLRLPFNRHITEHEDTKHACLIVDFTPDEEYEVRKDPPHFTEEADTALDALVAELSDNVEVPSQSTLH